MRPQDKRVEEQYFTFKLSAVFPETHPAKVSFTLKYFCVIKCGKLAVSKLLSYVMQFLCSRITILYLIKGPSQYITLLGQLRQCNRSPGPQKIVKIAAGDEKIETNADI